MIDKFRLFVQNLWQKFRQSPSLQRKFRWILLGVVALGLIFFISWKYYQNTRNLAVWELIPTHAVAVLEIRNPLEESKKLSKQPIMKHIANTNFGGDWLARVAYLSEMVRKDIDFVRLFGQKTLHLSWHLTAKESLNALLFFEIYDDIERTQLKRILAKIKDEKRYIINERVFKDFQITELKHEATGEMFSFFLYRNFFVGSFSAFLVEDVIRKIETQESPFQWTQNSEAEKFLETYDKDGQTLYSNIEQLPALMNALSGEEYRNRFQALAQLAEAGFLKLKLGGNPLFLNGYAFLEEDSPTFFSSWNEEKPQKLTLKKYVPNQTAVFFHFAFQNNTTFFKNYQNYIRSVDTTYLDRLAKFSTDFNADPEELQKLIHQEIALCWFSPQETETTPQILLLKTQDPKKVHELLEKIGKQSGSGKYLEKYAGFTCKHIGIPEFPKILLGELFEGFPTCFYTEIEGVFILANDEATLQKYLDQWEAKNMWTTSPKTQALFEQIESLVHFTMVINFEQAYALLLKVAAESWLPFVQNYETEIKYLGITTLQTIVQEGRVSTQMRIFLQNAPNFSESNQFVTLRYGVKLTSSAFSPPFLFKNPLPLVVIQDNNRFLYLIDDSGKTIWKRQINGAIQGKVLSITAENNTLHYAFITKNSLQLFTQEGFLVKGFPIYVPETQEFPLQTLAILDWKDGSSPYFLVSNKAGMVYLYDKFGKLQKGWNPKKLSNPLRSPAQSFNFDGKYYTLITQTDGRIMILDAEGKSVKGFPIQLDEELHTPIWIEKRKEQAPEFFYLTAQGSMIVFDFGGNIQKIEPFNADEGNFSMLISESEQDWIVVSQNEKLFTFYDKTGKLLFEHEAITDKNIVMQYFNDAEQQWLAINYLKEGKSYLYNLKGQRLGVPIKSSYPLQAFFSVSEQKIIVYRVFQQDLSSFIVQ